MMYTALHCMISRKESLKISKKLTMLGSPIIPEAIDGVLQSKLESLQLMCDRLKVLDPHDAFFY